MTRKPSGSQGMVGRAASFAVAMLAVLTLVLSGAFHELTHADDGDGPAAHVAAHLHAPTPIHSAGKSAVPAQSTGHKPLAAHSCSGHCGAHAATQAPLLALIPAPYEASSGWLVEASEPLSQQAPSGLERPPRA